MLTSRMTGRRGRNGGAARGAADFRRYPRGQSTPRSRTTDGSRRDTERRVRKWRDGRRGSLTRRNLWHGNSVTIIKVPCVIGVKILIKLGNTPVNHRSRNGSCLPLRHARDGPLQTSSRCRASPRLQRADGDAATSCFTVGSSRTSPLRSYSSRPSARWTVRGGYFSRKIGESTKNHPRTRAQHDE